MSAAQQLIHDFEELSVTWVVLSGGEPLMYEHIFDLCTQLRQRGIRVSLLSTGLLFERNAQSIVGSIDDAIVSLDGPPRIHDEVRRVKGAFASLERGVAAIHSANPLFRISARSTVQRNNFRFLSETAREASRLGLSSISFLAADLTSQAFNRPLGWSDAQRADVALLPEEIPQLQKNIDQLISEWSHSGFLLDRPEKLFGIVAHYQAYLGLVEPVSPKCNAPWTSTVIDADGTVRPCFFHRPIGHLGSSGLLNVLNSPEAVAFRSTLDITGNATCRRCVCSLNWKPPLDLGSQQ
jgi:MoaA/NifB/PqqE/SkfB family radical SAM enzyme